MPGFTKNAIKQAFIELLNEQPLNRISVRDIVERCGINRNSFYYHFQEDLKCRKPEDRIFRLALEKVEKQPEQCVFIDNSVANLKVASEIGMTSILFNRDVVEYSGIVVNSFADLEQIL